MFSAFARKKKAALFSALKGESHTSPMPRQQFSSIQILRGIAALMVVAMHLSESMFAKNAGITSAFTAGNSGVDIFFVISGFVMLASTDGRAITPLSFWKSRAIRIAPLYYIATLIYLTLYAAVKALPDQFSVMEILFSFTFIPFKNSFNGQPSPILGVGWTLNYEFIFYIIFGVALLIRHWISRISFIACVFVILTAGRLVLMPTNALTFRLTSPLYVEFLAGIFCGLWATRRYPKDRTALGLVAITTGFFSILAVSIWMPTLPRTLGYGAPATLIVCGMILCEQTCRRSAFAILHFLGDASYSIYLIHGIIIVFADPILVPKYLQGVAGLALLTLAAPGIGILCYLWIEKPLGEILRKATKKRMAITPLVSASAS